MGPNPPRRLCRSGSYPGFLSQAEEAVRAQPGDGRILLLAATAALLDRNPERAQVFLKRFSKRYVAIAPYQLLRALVLAEENKLGSARSVLEAHGLGSKFNALQVFPGGWTAGHGSFASTTGFSNATSLPPGSTQLPKPGGAGPTPDRRKPEPRDKNEPAPVAETPDAPRAPPALPLIDIDIPLNAALDLAPLLTAMRKPPESDGGWYGLRERFAHLGLAQGFDELLCLPHLRDIETFWYQVETVRKVLKQFRGRVLLADEVGLGKTIEAGMVLKEYLLRGMVDSVLVLTPASLVGQWREELETKFDIPCTTTHDALLRSDPDRFWNQKRLIASLALARRSEHAARLVGRSFDLVIVDEAHHLRDRTSQSYKLVDALNKRFLLLLSATPVQNDLTELYNVLTLLKPGIFKTLKEFRAAYMTPGKPRQPANPERLRALMRDAMVRNTRAVVALKLPRRHAVTIRVDGAEGERAAYQELAAAARRLAAEGSGRNRLALHHLLGAAGSSPAAAAAAVRRFADRHGDAPGWHALAQRWASVGNGGKEAALLDLLRRNPDEKKLVFVHYRETLDHLAELLAREGFAFARFDGGLSGPDKDAAIAAFRERVPVLLCTEFGRRRSQHPVLQHPDQFRRALESDGHRAAHRTHRSHRPAARGLCVQSRDPRHAGGADSASAGREDLHVRARGRRGGGDPGGPRGGSRFRRPHARCLAPHHGSEPQRGVRCPRPSPARGEAAPRERQGPGRIAVRRRLRGRVSRAG